MNGLRVSLVFGLMLFGQGLAWGALEMVTESLPAGAELSAYSALLQAEGGVEPYQWSVHTRVMAWGNNSFGQISVPSDLDDVVQVSGGAHFSAVLKGDGTVVAWGRNHVGQTDVPEALHGVVEIACGSAFALARMRNGAVVGWGSNGDGQVLIPPDLKNVEAITAGAMTSIALKSDGTVVEWGHVPESTPYPYFHMPTDLTNIVAISSHLATLALRADGTVVAWGYDLGGPISGIPEDLTNVVAIATGEYHGLALRFDGTLVAWGFSADREARAPAGLTNVAAIAAGAHNNLALKADGTLVGWNAFGYEDPILPHGLSGVEAIASGRLHSLALKSENTILPRGVSLSSGGLLEGTPERAGTYRITVVVKDAAGSSVVRDLDLVVEPHPNLRPVIHETNPPEGSVTLLETEQRWFHVDASDPEGEALTYTWLLDGTEVGSGSSYLFETTWGGDGEYSLVCRVSDGFWTNEVAASWWVGVQDVPIVIDATPLPVGMEGAAYTAQLGAVNGAQPYTWRLHSNVRAWGRNHEGQCTVDHRFPELVEVSCGGRHNLGLTEEGTVFAWGDNTYGQCDVPEGLSNVVEVAAGGYHSMALLPDGTVVTWGRNTHGQVDVPEGVTNAVRIAAGYEHSLALRSDNTLVYGWGNNTAGQGQDQGSYMHVQAIAAGSYHNLRLRSAQISGWGSNNFSQASSPPGHSVTFFQAIAAGRNFSVALWTQYLGHRVRVWGSSANHVTTIPTAIHGGGVLAIAAGDTHVVALSSNRTVVAWGSNSQGQTSVPESLPPVWKIGAGGYHTVALLPLGGGLPEGLHLSPEGLITGVPESSGTFRVTFLAADENGEWAIQEKELVIAGIFDAPRISAVQPAGPSHLELRLPTTTTSGVYSVEQTSVLSPADWEIVPGQYRVPGVGGEQHFTVPLSESNLVFRVRLEERL